MVQYAVVRSAAGWDVFKDGFCVATHLKRLDAIEDAYMLAIEARAQALRPELLVADEGGQLDRWPLTIWTGLRRAAEPSVPA